MANVKVKGENFYRDAKKVGQLNMYKEGKPIRNKNGDILKAASFQSREIPNARIEPNRKWFGMFLFCALIFLRWSHNECKFDESIKEFALSLKTFFLRIKKFIDFFLPLGNTRVISQGALTSFREAMAQKANDPYQVLLKQNKLPMSLLTDPTSKQHAAKIHVETEPFAQTFGPKAQRKRPKLAVSTLEDLVGECEEKDKKYEETLEMKLLLSGKSSEQTTEEAGNGWIQEAKEPIFTKGTSKRIWNELYKVSIALIFPLEKSLILTYKKVIDSSDVVIHVLDARDPLGTRCRSVEKYIKEEAPHKHLIFVLNKCDLVPTSVAVCLLFLCFASLYQPFFRFTTGPIVQVKAPSWSVSFGIPANFLQSKVSVTTVGEQTPFPTRRPFHVL